MLKNCVHIQAWAEKIISKRPYSTKASLLEYAEQLSQMWAWQEIQAALATHPKIGEREAKKQLNAKSKIFHLKNKLAFL